MTSSYTSSAPSEISILTAEELPLGSLKGSLRDSATDVPIPWSVELLCLEFVELVDLSLWSLVDTFESSAAGFTLVSLPECSTPVLLLPDPDSIVNDGPGLLTEGRGSLSIMSVGDGEEGPLPCSKFEELAWLLLGSMMVPSGEILEILERDGLVTSLLRDVLPRVVLGRQRWSRFIKLSDIDVFSMISRISVRRLWFWKNSRVKWHYKKWCIRKNEVPLSNLYSMHSYHGSTYDSLCKVLTKTLLS